MELNALKTLLRENGVAGAGGAGFPTYAKFSSDADTIILNCAECEPLLKLHRQLLEEHTHEILTAMTEVVRTVGAEVGIVAVKEHYADTVRALEAELVDFPLIRIALLRAVYPAGDELLLIKEVTGRTVQPGKLPISVGVTVCNVESMYDVYRAMHGKPVTDKYVTVAGEVAHPMTLRVPLGTSIRELIEAAGGLTVSDAAYISGGPMMGRLVDDRDVVTKTTNAILALPADHSVVLGKQRSAKINLRRAMSTCCQCRSCTELCSRHVAGYPVEPHLVMRVLSNGGRGDASVLMGAMFCSSCGLCETYSCPQGLSPRAIIDEIKATAKKNGIKPPENIEADLNVKDPELKKVSVERLTARLGLTKYDLPAPITRGFSTDSVKILLSQHIGAPAEPIVNEGDEVKKGDVIAVARDGALSVNIHASIDGRVSIVKSRYIQIKNT